MISGKETKKIIILRTILLILFFADLLLGIHLLVKDSQMWSLRWLWAIEGVLIVASIAIAIYRISITKKEYTNYLITGSPVLNLIVFIGGLLIYVGLVAIVIRGYDYDRKRMPEIKEDFSRQASYARVEFGNQCKEKHYYNMQSVVEMVNDLDFLEVGYGDKKCSRENYLFSVEVILDEYWLYLRFYRGTSWIEYYFSYGDIFPSTETFYIKSDSVEIEAIYNYIIENHEEFHKIEENKNGEE